MTIEPMGSIMSAQAQTITPRRHEVSVKETVQQADGSVAEAARVDQTISVVDKSAPRGETGQKNDQSNEKQYNEQIKKAVEKLNKNMANTEAVFGVHEGTNRVTIKIIDKDTKETIKELPPEKTLDMISKVWELAGILVDEKR